MRRKKMACVPVGRGPSHATRACERVPLAMRLAGRPPHLCRARSPDLDLFYRPPTGEPELQRWAQCLPVFALPPRQDNYRNGFMKHPPLTAAFWRVEETEPRAVQTNLRRREQKEWR